MVGSSLKVTLGIVATAIVCSVVFHNGGAELFYERPDKRRIEMIIIARFAGGKLDGNFAFSLAAECFVDFLNVFRGYILDEIHNCGIALNRS